MTTSLTIEGRVPSKKNSRKIISHGNRPFLVPSSDYAKWHKDAGKQLLAQHAPRDGNKKVQSIEIAFIPPNKIRGDLTNKAESIMDLLVDHGTLADDNWFEVPLLTLRFGGIDRKRPRAEITINHAITDHV